MQRNMEIALDELDEFLTENKITVEIVICGAIALQIQGYRRSELTDDVDTVIPISDREVLAQIQRIGRKLNINERWLNDQASDVAIPAGAIQRSLPYDRWKSIKALVISRPDLICMKASAYVIRRDITNKDAEDLSLLAPTKDEMEAAIEFIKQANCPPPGAPAKIIREYEESLNDLRQFIKG